MILVTCHCYLLTAKVYEELVEQGLISRFGNQCQWPLTHTFRGTWNTAYFAER